MESGEKQKRGRGRPKKNLFVQEQMHFGADLKESNGEQVVAESSERRDRGRGRPKRIPIVEEETSLDEDLGCGAKNMEQRSSMCHQCLQKDRIGVIFCSNCQSKHYCYDCISHWYPGKSFVEIQKACPFCCGNCNCKACLQDTLLRYQDGLQKLGTKIKYHEDNLRFLKLQISNLDEFILEMHADLGKYCSPDVPMVETEKPNHLQKENTVEQILRQENSAAGLLWQLKLQHETLASNLPVIKDVLGIVANLGKVEDDNLSRLFSEYLGLETMMAIVCKTYEGVKALEPYDGEGRINNSIGLHGLGSSIGRHVDGRILVICLEDLRPFVGDFVPDDPQGRLSLLKPRLPSGESPSGFLGFAVNMINLESMYLSHLTASGHGLRETLFYSLFSRLQVYRTRREMLLARPCISDGALSLDGGMIMSTGTFLLGNRKEAEVRFPVSSGNLPLDYVENRNRIKSMKAEKEIILEDILGEQTSLNLVKKNFDSKKHEYVNFIAESSIYTSQHHMRSFMTTPK